MKKSRDILRIPGREAKQCGPLELFPLSLITEMESYETIIHKTDNQPEPMTEQIIPFIRTINI